MFDYSEVTTIYVSPSTGGRENTGVSPVNDRINNGPFPTIERALEMVCEMRRAGYLQPVTVRLMEDITLSKCVTVKADKTAYLAPALLSDVTIESDGERRLISGGRRIEGWKKDVFNGAECLSVFLPEVKSGEWSFCDLYVNGEVAPHTRYPESGFLTPEDVECHGGHPHKDKSRWIITRKGDFPENMKNRDDVVVSFCHYWIDEHTPIKSFDSRTRKLVFTYPTAMTITPDGAPTAQMKYWLDNVAEAFGKAGQWYLDRPEGMLYYIPKEDETAENVVAYAPVCDRLFDFSGDIENGLIIRGVRIRDVALAYTKSDYVPQREYTDENGNVMPVASDGQSWHGISGAVRFYGCSGCSVEDSVIYCVGTYGVSVETGCDHVRVDGVTVRNVCGGGVKISGGSDPEKPEYLTHDVTVVDCTLCDLGKKFFACDGVLIKDAYDCDISHNDIHGLYYSGICAGWVWGYKPSVTRGNRICKNHIYDLGRGLLSDMGGVYLLAGQPGTVVSGNVIHDVKSRDYGGWGLYTDEGSSYILLENNICYNLSQNCYHQHYGMMNTVRNNIFAYADKAAVAMTKHEGHRGLLLENNVILLKEGRPVYSRGTSAVLSSDRNVIWDESGKTPDFYEQEKGVVTIADIRKFTGWDDRSVVANPRFRDAKNFDFTLRKDSPAFKLGFKPIDTSDVGPRK